MPADVLTPTHSVQETAAAYARGIAGGLLVGMPTLMTMEMWWGGFTIPTIRILLLVVVNFGVLLVLQHYSGLHPRKTPAAQLRAAIVAYAIGIVVSGVILLAFGVLRGDTVFDDLMRKIALQGVPVSLGASVAASEFGAPHEQAEQVRVVREAAESGAEAHFTLDWLPGRSTRRGIAVLPQNEALGPLRAEVAGYAEP